MPLSKGGYIVSSRFRIGMFYAYLIAIGVLAYFTITVVLGNQRIARESHRALCTFQVEREKRVDQTQEILDHPGDPANAAVLRALGRPLIVRSLNSAKSDLKALEDVKC